MGRTFAEPVLLVGLVQQQDADTSRRRLGVRGGAYVYEAAMAWAGGKVVGGTVAAALNAFRALLRQANIRRARRFRVVDARTRRERAGHACRSVGSSFLISFCPSNEHLRRNMEDSYSAGGGGAAKRPARAHLLSRAPRPPLCFRLVSLIHPSTTVAPTRA